MRLGFGLPQTRTFAGPDAVAAVARRAEELGFDDLWVFDRVLFPLAPRTPYPASPDGKIPRAFRTVLDPFQTLTFAAAHTQRIGLGTSVLNLPYYNPVLLARELTSIDVLSRGRLRVGLGTGWSADEFEAVGVPQTAIGKRTNEALRLLKAIWTTDPVEFDGEYFRVARSVIQPKPVQQPHPPIYFAAFTPAAMRRVGQAADGWLPAGLPVAVMQSMFNHIKGIARDAGRDPTALELVVRANLLITAQPLHAGRAVFTGTLEQIHEDIVATRQIGAAALLFDAQTTAGATSLEGLLGCMEDVWRLACS